MNELKANNKPVTDPFDICEILNSFFYLDRPFSSQQHTTAVEVF